jgi:hypothetical protein
MHSTLKKIVTNIEAEISSIQKEHKEKVFKQIESQYENIKKDIENRKNISFSIDTLKKHKQVLTQYNTMLLEKGDELSLKIRKENVEKLQNLVDKILQKKEIKKQLNSLAIKIRANKNNKIPQEINDLIQYHKLLTEYVSFLSDGDKKQKQTENLNELIKKIELENTRLELENERLAKELENIRRENEASTLRILKIEQEKAEQERIELESKRLELENERSKKELENNSYKNLSPRTQQSIALHGRIAQDNTIIQEKETSNDKKLRQMPWEQYNKMGTRNEEYNTQKNKERSERIQQIKNEEKERLDKLSQDLSDDKKPANLEMLEKEIQEAQKLKEKLGKEKLKTMINMILEKCNNIMQSRIKKEVLNRMKNNNSQNVIKNHTINQSKNIEMKISPTTSTWSLSSLFAPFKFIIRLFGFA